MTNNIILTIFLLICFREFSLQLAQGQLRLKSQPPKEVEGLYNAGESVSIIGTREIAFDSVLNLTQDFQWSNPLMYLDISFDIEQFGPNSHIAICFMNSVGQEICTGIKNHIQRTPHGSNGIFSFHRFFQFYLYVVHIFILIIFSTVT